MRKLLVWIGVIVIGIIMIMLSSCVENPELKRARKEINELWEKDREEYEKRMKMPETRAIVCASIEAIRMKLRDDTVLLKNYRVIQIVPQDYVSQDPNFLLVMERR